MKKSSGFSNIIVIFVIVLIGAGGVVGWYLHKSDSKKVALPTAKTTQKATPTPLPASFGFYDCFDKVLKFEPGSPPTCDYQCKTYTRSSVFTSDDVRKLEMVPASATQTVLDIAKKNFDVCKDVPDLTSVTRIYNSIDDSFVYLGTGCDSGYREILVNQNGKWIETAHSQGAISCADADMYKIPKLLVHDDTIASSDACYSADGRSRQLQN